MPLFFQGTFSKGSVSLSSQNIQLYEEIFQSHNFVLAISLFSYFFVYFDTSLASCTKRKMTVHCPLLV